MKTVSKRLKDWQDRRLVRQFLTNCSETAFRELYRRHTSALYGLALRMLGNDKIAAEEIVQDAWIRAAEKLPGFQGKSALRTWLSAIVINCCREHFRRQKQIVALQTESPEADVEKCQSFEKMDLEKAIAALSDGYRQVLVLHDVEGYTHKEIAKLLDIHPGTSKSQLFQARRKVRQFLQTGLPDLKREKHDR